MSNLNAINQDGIEEDRGVGTFREGSIDEI